MVSFVWPVPGFGRVTSLFRSADRPNHQGIDIGRNLCPPAPIDGAYVVAAADGRVSAVALDHLSMGNMVAIDHGDGFITRYMHNRVVLVAVGQVVRQGDVIALVGSTGYSTGPHLHFEVLANGGFVDPLGVMDGVNR